MIFSVDYVRSLMSLTDIHRYRLGRKPTDREIRIAAACELLNKAEFVPRLTLSRKVKGEQVFIPRAFEDKVCIKHLSERITRAYRVRHAKRHRIVRQIRTLLAADAKLCIIRTDIRRFFRSISFAHLLDRFRLEGRLGTHELGQLAALSSFALQVKHQGLLWGLGVSSTLAEIYAEPFDRQIRSIRGVYYYARFVDDIIIFTSRPGDEVLAEIDAATQELPGNLRLSPSKTSTCDETADPPVAASFCYLGYRFARARPSAKQVSKPSVDIDPKKIEKIKARMDAAFSRFIADKKHRDLLDRLRLLTGNYAITRANRRGVRRRGVARRSVVARTGIYYNYTEVTDHSQLSDLDGLLRKQVVRLRASSRRKGSPLPKKLLRELMGLSFSHGARSRIMHRFSRYRLSQLLRGWKDAR